MAIIGRRGCPWCGFEHSHVKQNEGKLPYHHCPECGMMTPAKNGAQAKLLKASMRPVGAATDGPQPPATDDPIIVKREAAPDPAPAAQASPAPELPKRPAGLWDQLMGKATK